MVAPQSSSFESFEPSDPASSSDTPPVSSRKLAANRRNARKSTGPRTADGKARSSRNSTSHGIFCRDLLLAGESEAIFRNIRESVLRRLRPQDALELMFVDRIVSAQWRLNRCQRSEYLAHQAEAHRAATRAQRKLDRTLQEWGVGSAQEARAELAGELDDPEDRAMRVVLEQLSSAAEDPELFSDAGFTLLQGMTADRSFARLALYEQRLERSIQRAMAELRRLRDRSIRAWADLPKSPYEGTPVVTDADLAEDDVDEIVDEPAEGGVTDDGAKRKNEPTASPTDPSAGPAETCDDAAEGAASDPSCEALMREIVELLLRGRERPDEPSGR